jgi:hypothetical protein
MIGNRNSMSKRMIQQIGLFSKLSVPLARGLILIPVTVPGARKPNKWELPTRIQSLMDYHAKSITANIDNDMAALVRDIRHILKPFWKILILWTLLVIFGALVASGSWWLLPQGIEWIAAPRIQSAQTEADRQKARADEAEARANKAEDEVKRLREFPSAPPRITREDQHLAERNKKLARRIKTPEDEQETLNSILILGIVLVVFLLWRLFKAPPKQPAKASPKRKWWSLFR